MKRNRRVKILATLGPASSDEAMIRKLHEAGADVFRINMSHTDHDSMRELVARIRRVEAAVDRPIGILADLQGPKLRVGKFAEGKVDLKPGDIITLDNNPEPGDATRVYLPHPEILETVQPGHRLLIDDGKLQLRALSTTGTAIRCEVVAGTRISDKKGVSLPDTLLTSGALTDKDRRDLDAVLEAEVDWLALSFIQRPEDLAEARKLSRGRAGLLSKIEKPQAVERLDEIIELSDAIMVARGDLGVEMPLEQVPGIQKRITRAARRAGKPVVVATQMLESMITAPVPTRAEVSDVSIAVFEGADAIMLSAESAAGAYPVEAVQTMDRIAVEVEKDPLYPGIIFAQRPAAEATAPTPCRSPRARSPRRCRSRRSSPTPRPARRAFARRASARRSRSSPCRRSRRPRAASASSGSPLRRHGRCLRHGGHGEPRLPPRGPAGLRARRRAGDRDGRRAAAHARRHQHDPHRLYRLGRPVGHLTDQAGWPESSSASRPAASCAAFSVG